MGWGSGGKTSGGKISIQRSIAIIAAIVGLGLQQRQRQPGQVIEGLGQVIVGLGQVIDVAQRGAGGAVEKATVAAVWRSISLLECEMAAPER